MFFAFGYYYYIVIGLAAICLIHSYRRDTLNRWLIVFLPFVGSLIYIYSEILSSRNIRKPKIDLGAVLNPGGKIKKLEDNLRFTDTFANKITLADAYLEAGYIEKAIDLYEGSLTGAFVDNEHVLSQLMVAYFGQERYGDVIKIALKIKGSAKFAGSKSHLLYAEALEYTGKTEQAEAEFKSMKGRYSNFEQRYRYGQFLIRAGKDEEARKLYAEIIEEVPHLSSMEKRAASAWISKSKEELRKLPA